MTILEAKTQYLENTYLMARKGWKFDFVELVDGLLMKYDFKKGKYMNLTNEDMNAEDWEVRKINFGRIS